MSDLLVGGGTGRKDPIYSFLKDRGRFPSLLHEQSLYLLGRSLQMEDNGLYQDALKLYETRNKIAHLGLPPPQARSLSLDGDGSRAGMDCARRVLAWFGEPHDYPDPLSRHMIDKKVGDFPATPE